MLSVCLFVLFAIASGSWTKIAMKTRPPPRRSASSTCLDDDFLIFGGRGQQSRLSDIWRFHNVEHEWKALPSVPVVGRSGSSMFVHTSANTVGIFGGRDDQGVTYNDLWLLVLVPNAKWERVDIPSPPGRFGSAYFHAQNHMACVYGGKNETSILTDGWCFDIFARQWTQLVFTGTIPGHVDDAAFVQHDHLLYLFGGVQRDTLFVLNTHNNQWHIYPTSNGPSARNDTLMGLVRHPFGLQLFGGRVGLALVSDPQWMLYNGEWIREPHYNPVLRWGATGCTSKTRIWMFGGLGANDLVLDDLWTQQTAPLPPSVDPIGKIGLILGAIALALSLLSIVLWLYNRKHSMEPKILSNVVQEQFDSNEF